MKKKPLHRIPVSRRALTQRVHAVLAKNCECLRTYSPSRLPRLTMYTASEADARKVEGDPTYTDQYTLFIVDPVRGDVKRAHLDLEELGRELGALKPYEHLDEGGRAAASHRRTP